MTMVMMVVLRQ